MEKLKFDEIFTINGIKLTKKYIESLNYKERESLIGPIFLYLRQLDLILPDDTSKLNKSYKLICDYKSDISANELFNNDSRGTDICKHFCKSFYKTTDNGVTIFDIFNDDEKLKKLIKNRLGMDWLLDDGRGPGVNEAFNLSMRMLIQGMRSMHLVGQISIFKPVIAKYICEKYSNVGDVVGDYSIGFGGRLLGAMSCGRKYIGTDPLTADEVNEMAKYFNFSNYKLIKSGSEDYCGDKDSVNLYWSSPPYYNQEIYSDEKTQAYNNGEDYFYNIYWNKTLQNVKYMLKTGGWFGLNMKNYPKMLDMAINEFGQPEETVKLRTVRSHLNKSAGVEKFEPIYMFKKR